MFSNRPALNQKKQLDNLSPDTVQLMKENLFHIRDEVQKRLLVEFDGEVTIDNTPQLRKMIEDIFNQVLIEEGLLVSSSNKVRMLEWVYADIVSYGPLDPFLSDPEVTEIMVNGPKTIFVEKFGKIENTNAAFEDDNHLRRII
ncbi:MAG: hypothetical protein ACKOBL_03130, partial [Chloroflexota bacterium]